MAVAETNVQNKISEQLKIVQSTQNVDTAFLDKTIRLDASQNLPPVCMLGEGPLVHNFAYRNARASQSHVKIVPNKQYTTNTVCEFQIECENGALLLPSTCDLCFTGLLSVDKNWIKLGATDIETYYHQLWPADNTTYFSQGAYRADLMPEFVTNKNFFWSDLFNSMRIYINDELVDEVRSTEMEQYMLYQQTMCPSSYGRSKGNYQKKMQDGFNRHNVSDCFYAPQHMVMRNNLIAAKPSTQGELEAYTTWTVTCNMRFPHEIFRKPRCLPPGAVMRIDMETSKTGTHYFFAGYAPTTNVTTELTTGSIVTSTIDVQMGWTPMNFKPTEFYVYMDKLYCTETVQIKSFLPFQSARDSYDFVIHNIRRSVVRVQKKFWWLFQEEQSYQAVCWPQKEPSTYVPSVSSILSDLEPLDTLQRITLQTEGTAPPFYFVYATYEEKDRLDLDRKQQKYNGTVPANATQPATTVWVPQTGWLYPVHCREQSWDAERRMWNIPCFDIIGMTVRGASYERDELEYTQSTPTTQFLEFVDRTYNAKRGNYTHELRTSNGFEDDLWRTSEAMNIKNLSEKCRVIMGTGEGNRAGVAGAHSQLTNSRWCYGGNRNLSYAIASTAAATFKCQQTIALQCTTYPQAWHMSHVRTIRETMQLREGEVVVEWYWKPFDPTMGVPGCKTQIEQGTVLMPVNRDARPFLEYFITLNFVPINIRAVSFTPEGVKVKDLTEIELTEDGLDRIA